MKNHFSVSLFFFLFFFIQVYVCFSFLLFSTMFILFLQFLFLSVHRVWVHKIYNNVSLIIPIYPNERHKHAQSSKLCRYILIWYYAILNRAETAICCFCTILLFPLLIQNLLFFSLFVVLFLLLSTMSIEKRYSNQFCKVHATRKVLLDGWRGTFSCVCGGCMGRTRVLCTCACIHFFSVHVFVVQATARNSVQKCQNNRRVKNELLG